MRSLTGYLLFTAILLAAGALALGAGDAFVFDSQPAIPKNPLLRSVSGEFDSLRAAALSSDSGSLRRPVAMFTFALNALAGGVDAAGPYRLTNIVIHLANALLVYLLVGRLLSGSPLVRATESEARWVAALAAGFWVLQPLSVTTVLYVVQRMAQLSALFVLAGLYSYVLYRERWLARFPRPGELVAALLWLLLFTGLAVYSKENGLLLLWAVALVEFCFFAGYLGGRHYRWLSAVTVTACLLPALLATALFLHQPGLVLDAYEGRPFSLVERLQTQGRVLWRYVGWSLSPTGPGAGLHHDDVQISMGWLHPITTSVSAMAWAAVLATALLLRTRWPVFAFAVLFFLVMHSFESTVFALEMVYEHRNYLPSVGLWMLAAWVLYQVCDRHAAHFQLPLVVVLMLAMTFATGWRASAWRDEAVLARVNLLAHPDSVRSRYHYANTTLRLAEAHRGGAAAAPLLQEARQGYRAMADMSPAGFTAPVSLIYIASVHDRDFPAAAREFEALRASVGQRVPQPEDLNALSLLIDCETAALCRLGSAPVLELLDRVQAVSAKAYYLETLRGRLLAADPGEASRAIAAFEAAWREYPGYVPADIGLARLLSGEGRDGEAVEVLRRLSAADPRRIQLPVLRASLDFGARD